VSESLRRIGMSTDHVKFMALAIEESRKGLRIGERPFGAVVVQGDEIIARTYSVVESSGDPTSHAETMAIRAATAHLKSLSLKDCTLYASCDPCPMCAGAILASHIERLVIGASSEALMRLTGQPPRSYSVEELSKQMNVKLDVIRGVLQDEAEKVLAEYRWPKANRS
jgi:tRNA(adenine34) deaminase